MWWCRCFHFRKYNPVRKSQNFFISDAWSLPVLLPRQVGAGGALGLLNTESHNTTSIFIFLSIRCHFKLNISFGRLSSQTKLGRQNTSIDEVTISFLLTIDTHRLDKYLIYIFLVNDAYLISCVLDIQTLRHVALAISQTKIHHMVQSLQS